MSQNTFLGLYVRSRPRRGFFADTPSHALLGPRNIPETFRRGTREEAGRAVLYFRGHSCVATRPTTTRRRVEPRREHQRHARR